jgi:hypothetical protein
MTESGLEETLHLANTAERIEQLLAECGHRGKPEIVEPARARIEKRSGLNPRADIW